MIKNKQQAGFSLIELMVALVIGLFVMGVVITVFVQSKRNYNQDEEIARLQESGRYAIQLLSRELAMAGFLGNMQLADSVTMSLPSGTVCDIDWNTESPLEKPIKVIDADSPPSCLTEALSGTEIVIIKHMRGQALSSTSADTIVMESNGKDGNMFVAPTDMTAPTDYQHWEFLVRAYYIADEDGDGVPGLYRKRVIASGGALQVQADGNLVPGVEDFRVTYGIDSAGNGIANYYTAAPSVTELGSAVSARVDILVRSLKPDPSYNNDKTYNLGSTTIAGASLDNSSGHDGKFYGRVFTSTVQMRNVAYHIQINNLAEDDL
jgi:type IV pilus assembly protein PilW